MLLIIYTREQTNNRQRRSTVSGCVILINHIGTCPPAQVKWTSPSSFGKISRQPHTALSTNTLSFQWQCIELHGPYRGLEAVTLFALISSGSEAAYSVCACRISNATIPRQIPQSHPTAASVYASLRCYAGCGPVMIYEH
jgi:hypothetical protein